MKLDKLKQIFGSQNNMNVILIDDARNFGSDPAYPTLEELKSFIHSNGKYSFVVKDDIIRITPSN